MKNHRPGGDNHLVGAGVATVTLSNDYPPTPNVTRLAEYWWDGETEPWYGDVGAMRSGEHIYAYGHAKSTPFVYVAQVKWDEATELNSSITYLLQIGCSPRLLAVEVFDHPQTTSAF